MNDIISVVTISLMPWRAFSHAGMSVQAAPTAIAMSARITQPDRHAARSTCSHGPRPATNAPASRILAVDAEVPEARAERDDEPAADDEDRRHARDRVGRPDARPAPAWTMSR